MKSLRASVELDRLDALVVIRDRLLGLRCAIGGAAIASPDDRKGLLQLADDLAGQLTDFCDAGARPRKPAPQR